jgi:hexosaminidase
MCSIAHLGGDEVFFECWNSSLKLQSMMKERGWELNTEGFMEVWGYFQKNVETTLQEAYNKKVPIILWSSTLTQIPYLTKYLNKDDVIIQMWTSKSRKADVEENLAVLDAGYKIIVSNYDTLYLDCGFSTFVRNAPDWCAPYHNWMEIYDNRMEDFSTEKYIDQVIGAEAAIWSEQISEYELDGRIWPRLSSLAERLWTGEFDKS